MHDCLPYVRESCFVAAITAAAPVYQQTCSLIGATAAWLPANESCQTTIHRLSRKAGQTRAAGET